MNSVSRNDEYDLSRDIAILRSALDKSAIVAITDKAGTIIHINDKFCKISQYSKEELLGQNHRILNSAYHGREFFIDMWKTISSGELWEGEIKNRAKNGQYYWVHTTIVPVLDDRGRPYQYISIRFEITDRKKAEEQVRIYADYLERSNTELQKSIQTVLDREAQILVQDRLASIGLLASSLAHEIGTPLGVIRGRAEYLEMLSSDNATLKKNVGIIISQIDRVSKLVHSLLTLARGDPSQQSKDLYISEAVEEVLELMNHEIQKRAIEVRNTVPKTALHIHSSHGSLQQVLLNLLVNSVHAIDSAIKARRLTAHFIEISLEDKDSNWGLSVKDSGCGISPENMKHLFKPFFTLKDVGVGTGLGLATSYRIAQTWNGSITVQSCEGVGSEFCVLIPKSQTRQQT